MAGVGDRAGDRLRQWIADNGLTQKAFAARLPYDVGNLNKCINNHMTPPLGIRAAVERETAGAIPSSLWEEPLPAEPEEDEAPELPRLDGTPAERLRTLETWLEGRARSGNGLSTDLHRAVTTMISSLQAQVRAKPIPELHEHPNWAHVIETILDGVEKLPGGPQAVLDAVRAALVSQQVAA